MRDKPTLTRGAPAADDQHAILLNRCRCTSLSIVAGLLVALVAASVASASAQESSADPAPRDFGGYLFMPSTVVPDPFVSTTFGTTTGFGKAVNLVVPVYNLHGVQVAETHSDIGFMLLGFNYQYAINRTVAVRVDANGSARVGTSATSVLAEGISALYGYGIGTSVGLVRKSRWLLSGTADLRGNTLFGVSPLSFVRAVVKSAVAGDSANAVTNAEDSLLTSGDNLRVLGGLRAAYTPALWIGFTGFLEAGMGEKFQKGSSNTSVANFGATVGVDLNPLTPVPIGLQGAFRRESLNEKGDNIGSSQTFGFGIFYTGRRFFSVGLENVWSRIAQSATAEKINAVQARIVLRYDFN